MLFLEHSKMITYISFYFFQTMKVSFTLLHGFDATRIAQKRKLDGIHKETDGELRHTLFFQSIESGLIMGLR
jgi:hypothetical protein